MGEKELHFEAEEESKEIALPEEYWLSEGGGFSPTYLFLPHGEEYQSLFDDHGEGILFELFEEFFARKKPLKWDSKARLVEIPRGATREQIASFAKAIEDHVNPPKKGKDIASTREEGTENSKAGGGFRRLLRRILGSKE